LTYLYKAQLWLAHENYKFFALRPLYLMIIKSKKHWPTASADMPVFYLIRN